MVDNEPHTRDFIFNVMSYCVNRKVLSFESPGQIVAHLEQGHQIHLLLANIPQADPNEFDSLKQIKRKFPGTCLIATSGNAADVDRAEQLGADVFLAKPFALSDLFKIVQDYVVDNKCGATDEVFMCN